MVSLGNFFHFLGFAACTAKFSQKTPGFGSIRFRAIPYDESESMQISFGTHWNVVSRGCTGCIKINFIDAVVLFLAVHYGAILIY